MWVSWFGWAQGKDEELHAKFVKEEEKESVRAQQQQPSCALGS